MDVTDRVLIVTGAGSGIGRATAWSFAKAGSPVVVSDISADRASAVADEIIAAGGRAIAVQCDVTEAGSYERLRDRALEAFGRIDVVMSNVGVVTIGQPEQIPLAEWRRVIDLNLLSVVQSNNVFVPHLLTQGSGHLIYTASSEGLFRSQGNMAPYSATKAAVVALADAMWLRLAPHGIGVTLLAPGPVLTNIVEQITVHGDPGALTGPELPLIDPAVVGDLVLNAVLSGRYMLFTHDGMQEMATRAANDRQAFLQSQLNRVRQDLGGDTSSS